MARTPMVTRTMSTAVVTCLVADVENKALTEVSYTLPRLLKKKAQLVKAMTALAEKDGYKFCDVVSNEVVVKKYGMTEQEFISHAHELD